MFRWSPSEDCDLAPFFEYSETWANILIIPDDQLQILNAIPGWVVSNGEDSTGTKVARSDREGVQDRCLSPQTIKLLATTASENPTSLRRHQSLIFEDFEVISDEFVPLLSCDLANRFCRSLPNIVESCTLEPDRDKSEQFQTIQQKKSVFSLSDSPSDQAFIQRAKKNRYFLRGSVKKSFAKGFNECITFLDSHRESRNKDGAPSITSSKSFENRCVNNIRTLTKDSILGFHPIQETSSQKNSSSETTSQPRCTYTVTNPIIIHVNSEKRTDDVSPQPFTGSSDLFCSESSNEEELSKKQKTPDVTIEPKTKRPRYLRNNRTGKEETNSIFITNPFTTQQVVKMLDALSILHQ